MPRKRGPERDRAREIWEADKTRPLTSIAEELGVSEGRVRKWKCVDKWEQPEKGTFPNEKRERSQIKKRDKKLAAMVDENEELNDKQKLFCLLYVKSFNATRSYQKAYGCSYETALSKGPALLKNPKVQDEIRRLKAERNLSLMADVNDLIELHMRIAFADMTDYATFRDGTVNLRPSEEIDGRLVAEVKEGQAGASIKLVDRQKSLAFLERYFEANPMDKHKIAYDNARLEIERCRIESSDEQPNTITETDVKLVEKVQKRLEGSG